MKFILLILILLFMFSCSNTENQDKLGGKAIEWEFIVQEENKKVRQQ